MVRKIVSIIALFAFTNFVVGCATYELISPNVFSLENDPIVQVVLKDGTIVKFDYTKGGGKYSVKEATLTVTNFPGSTSSIPLSKISRVYSEQSRMTSRDEVAGQRVMQAQFRDTKVVFDARGGKLDSSRQSIVGTDVNGRTVSLALPETKEVYTNNSTPIMVANYLRNPDQRIAEIITVSGRVADFDAAATMIVPERGVIGGITPTGEFIEVDVNNIVGAEIRREDTGLTALAVFVGLPVMALGLMVVYFLIAQPKMSCPFIYSYDGQQHHFDAEPLGGAICAGLQRTDISRLEHLKPTDGKYDLLVRNELDETEQLDELKLLVADHSSEQTVLPDATGNVLAVRNIQNATRAADEKGADLMKFLSDNDGIAWQTHMPTACTITDSSLRHEITLTFPKPKDAREAQIVHRIGTAMWGATMITKLLEYHGNTVDDWLATIRPGTESYKQLYKFLEREESYYLKLLVKKGETWVHSGTIRGQGPYATEDRVTTIDVSGLSGDSLVIRMKPPMGFWTIDYVGVSYSKTEKAQTTELTATWGEDDDGESILNHITFADGRYYTMPEIGDWAKLSFAVPPVEETGTVRTVFLKTTGYYEQHIDKSQPEKAALLREIMESPGFIAKVSMEEFVKWRDSQLAQNRDAR